MVEVLTANFLLISDCDKKTPMKGVQWFKTDMSNFRKFKYNFDEIILIMLQ